jgi:DNA-directed RNA polymerase specialized sigma24 family protein
MNGVQSSPRCPQPDATQRPPNLTGSTWQEAVLPLVRLVAWHAHRLCRRFDVPLQDRADVVAESLLTLCEDGRSAWLRGVDAVNCYYYAQKGYKAWRSRGRHWRRVSLLHDLFESPDRVLASRPAGLAGGLGPDWEQEARDVRLDQIMKRAQDERLQQVVRLRASGLTKRAIGARLGISGERVRQLLQTLREDGPPAAKKKPGRKAILSGPEGLAARRAVSAGEATLREVAERYGCDLNTVRATMYREGLPVPRQERQRPRNIRPFSKKRWQARSVRRRPPAASAAPHPPCPTC